MNKLTISGFSAVMLGVCLSATAAQPTEVVTVEAAREVTVGRSATTGAPIKEISIAYRVSYADLDLKTKDGAATLENRVREAAQQGCKELDEKYPLSDSPVPKNCVQETVNRAMVDARKAIPGWASETAPKGDWKKVSLGEQPKGKIV